MSTNIIRGIEFCLMLTFHSTVKYTSMDNITISNILVQNVMFKFYSTMIFHSKKQQNNQQLS